MNTPPPNDTTTFRKEYSLQNLIVMINFYVNAIEACQMQAALFPDSYEDIYKDMEEYALKYMEAIDKYLTLYDNEKVVSLAHTKYYKQLKKHKANGYML